MAEQQYIYVAASPASYASYTGYSQTSDTAYVQPGYTTMVQVPEQSVVGTASYAVPSYQYDVQSQQFSQTAQTAVVQNAAQSEYAAQAAYAVTAGTATYAQQVATQQAAGYGPQTVVYGSQGHLAAVQQAAGQAGGQQAAAVAPGAATSAFVQHGQPVVQQQLTMPVGYANQQLAHGQGQQIQYAIQQTATGTAYAAQPQALASLQAPAYAGTAIMAQQAGLAYGQAATAAGQPAPFGSQTLAVLQTQQPPTAFALQQQQTAIQQQQAAAVVAAAYGHTPQQAAIYGQQNLPSAFTPNAQASMVPLSAQQQQQHQQQLFITGTPGSVLGSPGLAAPAAFMAAGNATAGRTLSLPGQSGPLSGGFLHIGSQGQRMTSNSQRGFGGRDAFDGTNHTTSTGNHASGEMEIQRFPDTIFIQGLPDDTTEEILIQHFSSIGKLKLDTRTGKPRVTLVKDKVTGRPRGEATIGYQDIETVSTAIKMFNNKEFQGRKIRIEVASRKVPAGQQPQANSAVKRSHPGDDVLDWVCPNPTCNNQNFSWRTECNRCKGPRPEQDSVLKAAAALRRASENGVLGRAGLAASATERTALGLSLGLRAPASLQAASVASLAAATLRARLSGLSALGGLGMGLGSLPAMPGGPMRGALRGRVDRRGGRPY